MVKKHRKTVIQTHHYSYNPPVCFQVFVGEHWICTQIQRRKRFSKGFLATLRLEWSRMEAAAVDLDCNPTMLKEKKK